MTDAISYDRPNTVSGLMAKYEELKRLREQYKGEIKKLPVDIDHLEAAIRLFEPDAAFRAIQKHVTKHRAEKPARRPSLTSGASQTLATPHRQTCEAPSLVTAFWRRAKEESVEPLFSPYLVIYI